MPAYPISIAVVDDDAMIVDAYEMLFSTKGIPIAFIALDGLTALEKFRLSDPKPAVVIIDYRMPIMSGLELMRELRKLEAGIKIVFSSADVDIRDEALDAGGNAFLRKPCGIDAIMECINYQIL